LPAPVGADQAQPALSHPQQREVLENRVMRSSCRLPPGCIKTPRSRVVVGSPVSKTTLVRPELSAAAGHRETCGQAESSSSPAGTASRVSGGCVSNRRGAAQQLTGSSSVQPRPLRPCWEAEKFLEGPSRRGGEERSNGRSSGNQRPNVGSIWAGPPAVLGASPPRQPSSQNRQARLQGRDMGCDPAQAPGRGRAGHHEQPGPEHRCRRAPSQSREAWPRDSQQASDSPAPRAGRVSVIGVEPL